MLHSIEILHYTWRLWSNSSLLVLRILVYYIGLFSVLWDGLGSVRQVLRVLGWFVSRRLLIVRVRFGLGVEWVLVRFEFGSNLISICFLFFFSNSRLAKKTNVDWLNWKRLTVSSRTLVYATSPTVRSRSDVSWSHHWSQWHSKIMFSLYSVTRFWQILNGAVQIIKLMLLWLWTVLQHNASQVNK